MHLRSLILVSLLRCKSAVQKSWLTVALLLVHSSTLSCTADEVPRETKAERSVVVSVSVEASNAGVEVMKGGGNAVDAAVATAFALAVTHPPAGNIGGGGFMLIHRPSAKPICIDYREAAPSAAKIDMFTLEHDRHQHGMVGTPGTVRGLELAHKKFGRKPWKDLLAPAISLAKDGCVVDEPLADSLNEILGISPKHAELRRVFAPPNGKSWQSGDKLRQPDLAATLQILADDGPEAFYTGKIAHQILAEMEMGKGLISAKDLREYKAVEREPIHSRFRGFDVYGAPPPSSGGVTLAMMLNMLEDYDFHSAGRYSPETLHRMAETMKWAYCERAKYLGDPDFVKIPSNLTSPKFARKLAGEIDLEKATPSAKVAAEIQLAGEGDSTTHFSVIDSEGLAISNTYTLEESYGSRIIVRGAGFLLNNEMGDFNWRPGHTDRLGHIGTPANTIAPNKRMLSSMSPTIVAKDGRAVLITGSPGGRTIINTVLCVVINQLVFEMDLKDAVDAPRMHHQWFPDILKMERLRDGNSVDTLAQLKKMGHRLDFVPEQGDAHSIGIRDKTYHGVADRRRFRGAAVGW